MSSFFITSPAMKWTFSPPPISLIACCPFSAERPFTTTLAPCSSRISAIPRPMPRVPPVTTAVLLSRLNRLMCFSFVRGDASRHGVASSDSRSIKKEPYAP